MYEVATKTVGDVKRSVFRQFGDESEVQIDTADVIRWVNDGQREIVTNNTELNSAKATTSLVAAKESYPIMEDPAFKNLLTLRSIRVDGQRLRHLSFQEAEDYMVTKQDSPENNGVPVLWYSYAGSIMLWPRPETDVTDGLTIFFTKAPDVVSSETDTLGIPDSYYNALVDYALSKAYELDENANMSQAKTAQFEKSLNIQQNRTQTQVSEYPTVRGDPEDWY